MALIYVVNEPKKLCDFIRIVFFKKRKTTKEKDFLKKYFLAPNCCLTTQVYESDIRSALYYFYRVFKKRNLED